MNRRAAVLLLVLSLALAGCATGHPEPSPTVTVTAEPLPAVTVTAKPIVKVVTKTVTPPECFKALDAAERLTRSVRPALDNGAALAALIPEAYSAGVTEGSTGDATQADAMVAKVSKITESMKAATPEFDAAMAEYVAVADQCRNVGE